jgi:signal recognition particle GTPase
MPLVLLLLLLLFFGSELQGQEKYERESRVRRSEVPAAALAFVDSLDYTPRVRWYLEEGLSSNSFEAKFKKNQTRYSLEFSEEGRIEDIEKEIHRKDLNPQTRQAISEYLQNDCRRFRLTKIQRQYTGSDQALFAWLQQGSRAGTLVIRYEIVVRCRSQEGVHLYEYLFDDKGRFLSRSRIVFSKSSHLEY